MINFIKKHKKFVIVSSVIFAVLLTLIILVFTLFSLKSVSLNFKTETNYLTAEVQQEIVDEVHSQGIRSVLFVRKNNVISNLEKEFPYLKIINIETTYPSGFIIHCIEREELFAIESGDKVYYLDEEMKILRIEEGSFIKTATNAVLLNIADLNLNIQNAEEGQFINFGNSDNDAVSALANRIQSTLTSVLTAFEENNRNIAFVRANYESFKINLKLQSDSVEWFVWLTVTDNLGFKTEIVESNAELSEKIGIMLFVVGDLATNEPEKLLTHRLTIFKNISGDLNYLLENQ